MGSTHTLSLHPHGQVTVGNVHLGRAASAVDTELRVDQVNLMASALADFAAQYVVLECPRF